MSGTQHSNFKHKTKLCSQNPKRDRRLKTKFRW